MATASQADYSVTNNWTNIVSTIGAAASVDVLLQCVSADRISVVFGGSQPSGEKRGIILGNLDSVQGNAAAIWVKGYDPEATLSVTLL